MKKCSFLLIFVIIMLCGCSSEVPGEPTDGIEALAATEIGNTSYSCITGASEIEQVADGNSTTLVQAFSHRVYDPNNEHVVTLTSTVIGTAEDETALLSDIEGVLSDAQAEGFSVSAHISGDTGTIVLYRNQMSVCHFQYRIQRDGSIEFL